MKKIFIYFLLTCSLSLSNCGGIDEGESALGQFSRAGDTAAPPTDPEDTGNPPIQPQPRSHRLPDQGMSSETTDEASEPTLSVTLEENEEEELVVSANQPLTHLCIKNQIVITYYLYKPGFEDRLCELHYSGTSEFWFARFESDFCEKKLIESLNEKINKLNYTCYCGRPGGPDGIVILTDRGYKCASENN